jgi:microcystin-dependent protein
MSRNQSGQFTLPLPPVSPGDVVEAQWANLSLGDIGEALTQSLDRNGRGPMLAPLILSSSNPTQSLEAVSKAYVESKLVYATGMPVASVCPFASLTAPVGWLKCDGAAVSRATYSVLFGIIGTTYGVGDGSTTFNLPNLVGEFIRGTPVGRDVGSKQAGSFAAHTHPISDPGHTHGASQESHSHSITTGSHGHTVNDPGHTHAQIVSATPGSGFAYGSGNVANGTTGSSGTGISINTAGNLGGSSDAKTPNVTVASAVTGETIGSTGGTETVPQNVAMDYYIKALPDATGNNSIVSITSSDTNMIAIDETNPAIPVLDIKSNVAFGTVKLDSAGQIPVNLMPTTGVTYQGQLDASSGNLPIGTFVTGDFYNIAVGGTLSLMTSAGGPVPKAVVTGDQIIYDASIAAWWYNAASAIASIAAAAVTFVPHGTIAATNAQAAIEELDSETQTALSGKAPSSASTAVGTSFTPTGNVAATEVQTAIAELDAEKIAKSGDTLTGQLQGITPVAAADLTRKDYVDTKLPLAGGTVTGQIKGITPVAAADLTRKDYVDGVVSQAGNGYVKLPNGLIIQWGKTTGTGQRAVTFPIPFPTGVHRVLATMSDDAVSTTTLYSVNTSFISPSGCRVTPQFFNGTTIGIASEQASWIAIGY